MLEILEFHFLMILTTDEQFSKSIDAGSINVTEESYWDTSVTFSHTITGIDEAEISVCF